MTANLSLWTRTPENLKNETVDKDHFHFPFPLKPYPQITPPLGIYRPPQELPPSDLFSIPPKSPNSPILPYPIAGEFGNRTIPWAVAFLVLLFGEE